MSDICIIFSSNYDIALNKLLEIEEDKKKDGIESRIRLIYPLRPYLSEITFSDDEKWVIVNPKYDNNSRGYRWRKAWVDASNVSISTLNNIIIPTGQYKFEHEQYFNW